MEYAKVCDRRGMEYCIRKAEAAQAPMHPSDREVSVSEKSEEIRSHYKARIKGNEEKWAQIEASFQTAFESVEVFDSALFNRCLENAQKMLREIADEKSLEHGETRIAKLKNKFNLEYANIKAGRSRLLLSRRVRYNVPVELFCVNRTSQGASAKKQ
ncbi:MAG: hypothetical protein ABIH99_05940 [Candidatus Micrarchaeota archaeon]